LATTRPTISTRKPDPRLHTSLVASVQQFVNRIPARDLEPLQQNELFENSEDDYIRVQNFAFSQGFAVGGNPKERIQLHCIHHGVKTQNTRKLLSKKPISASGMANDSSLSLVVLLDSSLTPQSHGLILVVSPAALNIGRGRILQCKEWTANGKPTLFLSVLLEGEQLKGDGTVEHHIDNT